MDTIKDKTRSWVMAQVKSSGNKSTEVAFVTILRRNKIIGWRRSSMLFGRPDFIFAKKRVAIFVDGCFWHGHPKKCRIPKSHRAYWLRNIARDKIVTRCLRQKGWEVVKIWEDAVNNRSSLARLQKVI